MILAENFRGLVDYKDDDDLGWCKYVAFRVRVNIEEPLL